MENFSSNNNRAKDRSKPTYNLNLILTVLPIFLHLLKLLTNFS